MVKVLEIPPDFRPDIAVVGGGLAGIAMALALRSYPGKVLLIDANVWPLESDAPFTKSDVRNIVLADSSVRIFESLGVWSEIADWATPVHTIHVSEKSNFGVMRIRNTEEKCMALGWVVPYSVLHGSLRRILCQTNDVVFMPATQVEGLETRVDGVTIRISNDDKSSQISADLVILADGGGTLLEQAGFAQKEFNYPQTAIVSNIETEIAKENIAYERFTQHGPMAILPKGGKHYGVVWPHTHRRADEIMNWDESRFIRELQADFGRRLGMIQRRSEPVCYPLRLRYVEDMVKDRILALGNAAHTLHPVAGQSFNLTLRDVAALAECLFENTSSAFDSRVLHHWQQQRLTDIKRVTYLTDLLASGFTTPFLSPLRCLALLGLDICPMVRRSIVRRSLGLSPPLSRLASGLPLVQV